MSSIPIDLVFVTSRNRRGLSYDPHLFTCGSNSYDPEGDELVNWDGKSDVIAWYYLKTTIQELYEFTMAKNKTVTGKPYQGHLIGFGDIVRFKDTLTLEVKVKAEGNISANVEATDFKYIKVNVGYVFHANEILKAATSGKSSRLIATKPIHIVGLKDDSSRVVLAKDDKVFCGFGCAMDVDLIRDSPITSNDQRKTIQMICIGKSIDDLLKVSA